MGAHGQRVGEIVQQARQIEVQRLYIELLCLDLGEVEDVVDQTEQRFSAGAHDFGVAPLIIVKIGIQQQSGHADDPVHRGSDLMAHICQELALGGAGHLGLCRHFFGPGGSLHQPAVGLLEFYFPSFLFGDVLMSNHHATLRTRYRCIVKLHFPHPAGFSPERQRNDVPAGMLMQNRITGNNR